MRGGRPVMPGDFSIPDVLAALLGTREQRARE